MRTSVTAERVSRQYLVGGHVQGVGFRAATRRRAMELGVRGFARNLDDGRVEVRALGSPEAVQALADWLATGPALARVDSVDGRPAAAFNADGFIIL